MPAADASPAVAAAADEAAPAKAPPAIAAATTTAATKTPPPGGTARAKKRRKQRSPYFVYEFTLAQPPHPSPEDFYAPPQQQAIPEAHPSPGLAALMMLARSRRPAAPALALAASQHQRYAPHPHASGNPCTNCGIAATSTWRRLNPTRELSCNSCSDYFRRRGRYRPVAGLPARVMHVDLVPEGDTWANVVARRRQRPGEVQGEQRAYPQQ